MILSLGVARRRRDEKQEIAKNPIDVSTSSQPPQVLLNLQKNRNRTLKSRMPSLRSQQSEISTPSPRTRLSSNVVLGGLLGDELKKQKSGDNNFQRTNTDAAMKHKDRLGVKEVTSETHQHQKKRTNKYSSNTKAERDVERDLRLMGAELEEVGFGGGGAPDWFGKKSAKLQVQSKKSFISKQQPAKKFKAQDKSDRTDSFLTDSDIDITSSCDDIKSRRVDFDASNNAQKTKVVVDIDMMDSGKEKRHQAQINQKSSSPSRIKKKLTTGSQQNFEEQVVESMKNALKPLGGFLLVSTADLKRQISIQSKNNFSQRDRQSNRKWFDKRLPKAESIQIPDSSFTQPQQSLGLRRATTDIKLEGDPASQQKKSPNQKVTIGHQNEILSQKKSPSSSSSTASRFNFLKSFSLNRTQTMKEQTTKSSVSSESNNLMRAESTKRGGDHRGNETFRSLIDAQSHRESAQVPCSDNRSHLAPIIEKNKNVVSNLSGFGRQSSAAHDDLTPSLTVSYSQSASESFDCNADYQSSHNVSVRHPQALDQNNILPIGEQLGQENDAGKCKFQDQHSLEEDNLNSRDKRDEESRNKVAKACLIHPETRVKQTWELLTSIALIIACFMTPFGLAFEYLENKDTEYHFQFSDGWSCVESIVDIIFMLEVIVSFNTSYYEMTTNKYVISRRLIATKYLKGWFWVDFLAILPRFMQDFEASHDSNEFVKALAFFKIARIGRLIKLLRLLKIFKTLKQKDKMKSLIENKTRMSVAKERLLIFSVFAILFVHTIACLWIMLGVHEDPNQENWIDIGGFDHDQMGSMYTIGIYWTITTITTVGYGDISATNTSERIVACIIMVIGVLAFSFSTGALSSIIANADSRQAAYRQKLDVLKQLRMQYNIHDDLYMELTAFINFQSEQRHEERENFINELPQRLKYRLSELLYEDYKKKIFFLQQVQSNTCFIAWLCPNLKPLEVIKDALIQVEQEKLTCISFIKQGTAAYVSERYMNKPYLICSEGDHFGVLDIVFRLREFQKQSQARKQVRGERRQERQWEYGAENVSSSSSSSDEEDFAVINQKIRCKFTIQATKTCYLLQMDKQALEKMRTEFPEIWEGLLKDEFAICLQAIKRKAQIIRTEERLQQQDEISLEEHMLGSGCDDVQDDSFREDDSSNSSSGRDSPIKTILVEKIDSSSIASVNPPDGGLPTTSPAVLPHQMTKADSSNNALKQTLSLADGNKDFLGRRKSAAVVSKEPLTMKQLREMGRIQEVNETSSTSSLSTQELNESKKESEHKEEGKQQQLQHQNQTMRNNSVQMIKEPHVRRPSTQRQVSLLPLVSMQQLDQGNAQASGTVVDSNLSLCFNQKDLNKSQLSLKVPSRKASSSCQGRSNSDAESESAQSEQSSQCGSVNRRRLASQDNKSATKNDGKQKKKTDKLTKGLDAEELMVFEGFDQDVRNASVIQKRVKGLTKKSKHHKNQTEQKDQDMKRTFSPNPNAAYGRRMSYMPPRTQPLIDNEALADQHNTTLDTLLLVSPTKELKMLRQDTKLNSLTNLNPSRDRFLTLQSKQNDKKVLERKVSLNKSKTTDYSQIEEPKTLIKTNQSSTSDFQMAQIFSFQEKIMNKVTQLAEEISMVKKDQDKLLKQSGSLSSGHKVMMDQISQSHQSARSSHNQKSHKSANCHMFTEPKKKRKHSIAKTLETQDELRQLQNILAEDLLASGRPKRTNSNDNFYNSSNKSQHNSQPQLKRVGLEEQ